ncbi:MAG: hypothetical protein WAV56_02500 [Microgenomates group bacterium]
MDTNLPEEFQPLFPSSEIKNLQAQRDKRYIIQELLKNSTLNAWKWMFDTYPSQDVIDTIKNSKSLTKKDVSLWSNYFDIPKNQIRCLQTKSQDTPKTYWLQ